MGHDKQGRGAVTVAIRADVRRRLVELAAANGVARNDLDTLLGHSEKLLDRFAQSALRALLPIVKIDQVVVLSYDLAEQMMAERSKRLGREKP